MEISQKVLNLYQVFKKSEYYKSPGTIFQWRKFISINTISEYNELLSNFTDRELFHILKTELPYSKTCPVCGKELVRIYDKAYLNAVYCSKECNYSQKGIQLRTTKTQETNMKIYGVSNPNKSPVIRSKTIKTNNLLYGGSSPTSSEIIKEKQRKSLRKQVDWNNFISMLKTKHLSLLSTQENYIDKNEIKLKCDICGKEFSEVRNGLTGASSQYYFCPNRHHSGSNSEKEVAKFVQSFNKNIILNSRKIINGYELDIYIPEKNLAIEFDGIYWHSNANVPDNYHLDKTLACEAKGIQLLHIFENEWEFKQDIVKDIIKAKLGYLSKRIPARKCVLGEVSKERYKEFIETYHIQGYVPSKEILGLYYDNQLVEVCSFGKSRFKKGEMELLRHASIFDTIVIGGFSKIISYWKRLHPEESLISYVDRRYSTGKSYLSSGWTLDSISAPNYFYTKDKFTLESRIKYQKHKLINILPEFDPDLTEKENMTKAGYLWIYDCGNFKFKI